MFTLEGLLLDSDDEDRDRIRLIVEFWNAVSTLQTAGRTSWEVLRLLEREVTECLYLKPRDLGRAESLTAYAALLIGGYDEN